MPSRPSPFGKESRVRILKQHLAQAGPFTAASAWQFIYRELLWIDGSTGLAHLYESDKAQPGRPWYDRTVVFTDALCERFGTITRDELKQQIDQLFRACLEQLVAQQGGNANAAALVEALTTAEAASEVAEAVIGATGTRDAVAELTTSTYTPDVDLVAEFTAILREHAQLPLPAAEGLARALVARARLYFTVGNKRQNVLGEGFEDLLQLLLTTVSGVPAGLLRMRRRANELPGFQHATTRKRIEAPDLAIVYDGRTELLASIKWSLRHDRQKQLSDELDCYVDLLSQERFPQYVLITNEYDPGRLVNTAGLNRRGQRIDQVYHVNLELLQGALQGHSSAADLEPLITSGRLRSVEDFLGELAQEYGPRA